MMSDVNEYRAKKEGRVTPKQILSILEKKINDGEIESLCYVAKTKEGMVHAGWSDMLHTEVVGLLEVGKVEVIQDMYDDEE